MIVLTTGRDALARMMTLDAGWPHHPPRESPNPSPPAPPRRPDLRPE